MVFAICIHVCNFRVDGFFEMVWVVESLVCEVIFPLRNVSQG